MAVKLVLSGVPVVAQWLMNLTSIHEHTGSIPGLVDLKKWGKKSGFHEVAGSIPSLAQWVKDPALP